MSDERFGSVIRFFGKMCFWCLFLSVFFFWSILWWSSVELLFYVFFNFYSFVDVFFAISFYLVLARCYNRTLYLSATYRILCKTHEKKKKELCWKRRKNTSPYQTGDILYIKSKCWYSKKNILKISDEKKRWRNKKELNNSEQNKTRFLNIYKTFLELYCRQTKSV